MRVNLLEEDRSLHVNWLEVFTAVLIILTLAIPALNYYINYIELNNLEEERNMWQERLAEIRPQEERYFELQEEIENFRLPEEVEVERYAIAPAFREFGLILPEGVSFASLDYDHGSIIIQGHARNVEELLGLVGNIFESEIFSLVSLERFMRDGVLEFNMQVNMHTRDIVTGNNENDEEEGESI